MYIKPQFQEMLDNLEPLWQSLSKALEEMTQAYDSHAVLSLQSAAEAFFLAHAFAIQQKEPVQPTAQPAASATADVPAAADALAADAAQPTEAPAVPPSESAQTSTGAESSAQPAEPAPEPAAAAPAEAPAEEAVLFPLSPSAGAGPSGHPMRLNLNKHTQNLLEFAGTLFGFHIKTIVRFCRKASCGAQPDPPRQHQQPHGGQRLRHPHLLSEAVGL